MTDLTPTRNLLNPGEGLVLTAIREWQGRPESQRDSRAGEGCVGTASAISGQDVPQELTSAVAAFLDLLWRCDPFTVNFNPLRNKGMTLFELQVVYVLGEWRRGNHATVHELLAWWLPDVLIAHGRALIAEVSEVLDDLEIDYRPSTWVHAHFFGDRAEKKSGGAAVPTGTRLLPSGVLSASRVTPYRTH